MRRALLLVLFIAGCGDTLVEPRAEPPGNPAFGWYIYTPSAFDGTGASGCCRMTGDGISPNGDYIVMNFHHPAEPYSMPWACTPGCYGLNTLWDPGLRPTSANAINNSAIIVGVMNNQPVFWNNPGSANQHIALPLPSGHTGGIANDVGAGTTPIIVGHTIDATGKLLPARWSAGSSTVMTLPDQGEGGSILALNEAAAVAVGYVILGGLKRVAKWNLATNGLTNMGVNGEGNDVNSSGMIVGYDAGVSLGFRMATAGSRETVNAFISAINDNGLAVGYRGNDAIAWGPGDANVQIPYADFWGSYPEWKLLDIAENNKVVVTMFDGSTGRIDRTDLTMTPDTDDDGVPDFFDNCDNRANPDQADADDDDIGNACDPDHPPIIEATANRLTVPEGTNVRFKATGFDPGGRTLSWLWTFPFGAFPFNPTTSPDAVVSRSFIDEGVKMVTLKADNGAPPNNEKRDTIYITVTNVPPDITASLENATIQSGDNAKVIFDIRDPGLADGVTVSLNWGDGVTAPIPCGNNCTGNSQRQLLIPRLYRITITGTDSDGAVRKNRLDLTVTPRNFAIDALPGDAVNVIDLSGIAHRNIEVAVLGSLTFDPSTVDAATVLLDDMIGRGTRFLTDLGVSDVNSDGIGDRRFVFRRASLVAKGNLTPGVTNTLRLSAKLTNGRYYEGATAVSVVN